VNLLTLFLYGALAGMMFLLPFNLVQVQGYTPVMAGASLLPLVATLALLSRWSGGPVDRYGAKLPLVIGPLVAAVGYGLFVLPGRGGSYWTTFFPAVVVMSVGMAACVAPLTTTVMSAVDERHAGTASGVNNAVSRLASLLAIAVFGVVAASAFNRHLDRRLEAIPLPTEAKRQLEEQRSRLAAATVPAGLASETRVALEQAIDESFLAGFRRAAWVAVGLAVASAMTALLMLGGDRSASGPGSDHALTRS